MNKRVPASIGFALVAFLVSGASLFPLAIFLWIASELVVGYIKYHNIDLFFDSAWIMIILGVIWILFWTLIGFWSGYKKDKAVQLNPALINQEPPVRQKILPLTLFALVFLVPLIWLYWEDLLLSF